MKYLQEVIRDFHRVDDEQNDEDLFDFEYDLEDPDAELTADDDVNLDPDAPTDDETPPDDEFDDSELLGDDPTEDPMAGFSDPSGDFSGSEGGDLPDDVAPEEGDNEVSQLDSVVSDATENPDRQGAIRTVKHAHLVYKREGDEGYEELWVYNVGTMKDELEIRKNILSGTDIPPGKTTSPDGSQSYTTWASGNAEVIHITGLPN